MGKNKQKSKQDKGKGAGNQPPGLKGAKKGTAFKVLTHKVTKTKHKAKPITTNLKRLNVQNRQQVSQSDKVFTQLQRDIKTKQKEKLPTAANKPQTSVNAAKQEAPNMDEAIKQMACL